MIGLTSRITSPSIVVEQPQHPVGRRVVGTDVERQQLVDSPIPADSAW